MFLVWNHLKNFMDFVFATFGLLSAFWNVGLVGTKLEVDFGVQSI